MEIKVFSNNVNRLNIASKRNKIFNKLKKDNYDVIALQETPIDQRHVIYLTQEKLGKVFFASDLKKKRGVALYVKEKLLPNLIFKDTEGRFIGITVMMGNLKTLICNIYAPNDSKTNFINILKTEYDEILLLGDFNGVLDPQKDRTRKERVAVGHKAGQLPGNFMKLKEFLDLNDIWHYQNPFRKDYTFYFHRYNSWSRIDMVWGTNTLLTKCSKVKIEPRILSDHCALSFKLNSCHKVFRWKLDDNLLKKKEDIEKNRKLLLEYFKLNDLPEISIMTKWEASKAVMRGYLFQQQIRKNRDKNKKIQRILQEIGDNEGKLKRNLKKYYKWNSSVKQTIIYWV